MAIDVEVFATRLVKHLSDIKGHPAGYLMSGNLASAIQMALTESGTTDEFPKMLYKGPWNEQETTIVNSSAEEANALAAGWNRTQALEPPSKFPLNMVEIDVKRGTDYRRVLIKNLAQEETLRRVVPDPSLWVPDPKFFRAGRPVGLDELIAEHAARLHQDLDAKLDSDIVGHGVEAEVNVKEVTNAAKTTCD